MLMRRSLLLTIVAVSVLGAACRYDMQDQPRYKAFKKMPDLRLREIPEGTVARGNLRDNKALYTGKKEGVAPSTAATTVDASGNTIVTSFPDAVEEFPIPVTKDLLDRGEAKYKVFCGVCHGATGNGDGMIVRRGFTKPPTYHDDRLRNAPVGHFFDVATNGWGRMNGYSAQISVQDRWAIVAYIRALQAANNPTAAPKPAASPAATASPADAKPTTQASPKPETDGGHK